MEKVKDRKPTANNGQKTASNEAKSSNGAQKCSKN